MKIISFILLVCLVELIYTKHVGYEHDEEVEATTEAKEPASGGNWMDKVGKLPFVNFDFSKFDPTKWGNDKPKE